MSVESILRTKGSRVVTIAPGATVARALALLARENIGAVVVSADGRRVAGGDGGTYDGGQWPI